MSRQIVLVGPDFPGFSGQSIALDDLARLLLRAGYQPLIHKSPALQKGKWWGKSYIQYAILTFGFLWRVSFAARNKKVIYLSISQSLNGLVRDLVTVLLVANPLRKSRLLLGVHGSWFAGWKKTQLRYWLMRLVLAFSSRVIALGPEQAKMLLAITTRPIQIVPNTTFLPPCTLSQIEARGSARSRPLRLLFLSHISTDKGFRELIQCVLALPADRKRRVHLIFCGGIKQPRHSIEAMTEHEVRAEFESLLAHCRSQGIVTTWFQSGLTGEAKTKLLARVDVLALLSRIEAQPISIIEALSAGCAILATKVGEIPNMVPGDAGILVESDNLAVATAGISHWCVDRLSLVKAGARGLECYARNFSPDVVQNLWKQVLEGAA